jgi:flagella basal body P-ring formation protein FlgA
MARATITALAAALAVAGPALAGQPVTLRADTASSGRLVTLGDLFEGAGAKADVPVASRTGDSVVLNARIVQAAAARVGLDWANAEGLKTIVVRAGAGGANVAGPAAAHTNVEILTYARDIAAGEVLSAQDVIWGKAAAAPANAAQDTDALIGMTARRPLRAGAAALARDVATPIVVKAGEVITVSFQADGISLSLQGKALGAAGVGEAVNVENTTSKKTIQAVVTGPGQAVVGDAAAELKSARSTRIAAR